MIDVPELKLLPFEHEMLKKPVQAFDFENPPHDPKRLKESMEEFMFGIQGAGLSANQVGVPYAVFVMSVEGIGRACFNPKIHGASKETCVFKEGCLSLPGIWLSIARPMACLVSFQDENGNNTPVELSGVAARVFQHEYDHMLGQNFTQRASPLKLKRALQALKKKNGNV